MMKKKFLPITLALCLTLALGTSCFAASGDLANSLDFSPIISSITGAITPTDIIIVVGAVVAAGMGFVLAWFGIKKVLKVLRGAIKNGSINA